MSESLYRKYRPSVFADVRGQDHVVSVLEQSIKKGSFGHAYVFAGSRGTGKTSVARIFASALKVSPEDLYEIDAASNTGVDDIRDIRDGVGTMPFSSPYKVYLLDEAHMLSKQAWNALLKTLEEPPKHCIFILATTELDKVPETVLSRCQTFTFKKPTDALLKETIEEISKSEGFTLEKSASELIAFLADGSFRDAQSILQKILSASDDKKVSLKEVELVTGAPCGDILNECIEALEAKSSSRGLEAIDKALKDNIDMKIFIKLLLERVRTVLLLRFAVDLEKEIKENTSEKDFTFLHSIAHKKGSSVNSKTLDDLLRAYEETSFAAIKALPLQLVFIRLEEK